MNANGFAAAVQPISADTIHTAADELIAGEVEIACGDGFPMPAFRAMPKPGLGGEQEVYPLVLVVQEIFGLHEYIRTSAGASPCAAMSPSRRRPSRGQGTRRAFPRSTKSAKSSTPRLTH